MSAPDKLLQSASLKDEGFFDSALRVFVEKLAEFSLSYNPAGALLPEAAERERRQQTVADLLSQRQASHKLVAGIQTIIDFIETSGSYDTYHPLIENLSKISSLISTQESFDPQALYPQTLQELLGINNTCLEQIYSVANTLFEQEKWEQALSVFEVLVLLHPFMYAFWYGFGISSIHLAKFDDALVGFSVCSLLEPQEIAPRLFAVECYTCLKEKPNAQKELDALFQLPSAKHEPWTAIIEKVKVKLEGIET